MLRFIFSGSSPRYGVFLPDMVSFPDLRQGGSLTIYLDRNARVLHPVTYDEGRPCWNGTWIPDMREE